MRHRQVNIMFAVIKTGGKQYKVAQDDVITVEKLDADAGSEFVFDNVLMIGEGDKVEMNLQGAQVVGEVVEQTRADKVIIFKKRQRNTYRRKKGHRQHQTLVRITEILEKGGKTAAKKAASPKAEKAAPAKADAPKAAPDAKAAPAPAEAKSDDLTKLTGIGKVAAGKLVEAGYTSYAQMAALNEEQFAELDTNIFKGRVPFDQLVAESKDLA